MHTGRGRAAARDARWGVAGVECRPCPEGGTCPGATFRPNNQRGFYGNPAHPTRFHDRCDGCRKYYECADGWRGPMCKELVSPDFFMVSEMGPWRCPRSRAMRAANVLLGVGAVVALWLYVNEHFLDAFPSLDLMCYFMQLVAIVCRYRYDRFPAGMAPYTVILDVALFDIDVFKPTCVMRWFFLRSVVAQLLVIVIGVLATMAPIARRLAVSLWRDRALRSPAAVRRAFSYPCRRRR